MSDVDISAFPSLDFRPRSGTQVVLEAVLRRLSTPRGGLFYAPDYGLDLREVLLSKLGPQSLYQWKAAIEQEALQDDRVASASAALSYDAAAESVSITLTLALADGAVVSVLIGVSGSSTVATLDSGTQVVLYEGGLY